MDAADILKAISGMRHDFLNHLQVISGYLQLNKNERAGEYIREVTQNLQKLSNVVHLSIPEMAAAFLLGEELAAGVEVRTEYNVNSNLKGCTVPGDVAGGILYSCLQEILTVTATPEGKERPYLVIDIWGVGENCGCILKFSSGGETQAAEESLGKIQQDLARHGGRLEWSLNPGSGRLDLVFPRRAGE